MQNHFSLSFFEKVWVYALLFILITLTEVKAQCDCDFTIPAGTGTFIFNGPARGVQPGDVICIAAGARDRITFQDIVGAPENYVIIKNCGGVAAIGGLTSANAIIITGSKYFKVTGTGDTSAPYGIKIVGTAPGKQGIVATGFSSDMEIDHIEITKVGFAGIMAKNDPSSNCADKAAERPNFTLSNVHIHDCWFHDIGGEGIYLGNSFYKGTTVYCGSLQYPHEVRGVRIHDNLFQTTGWESIQVGSAVSDVEVYNNRIYNYGAANTPSQNGGIQMGVGTTGRLYNNFVKGGTGAALVIQGIGENYVYNNIVINPGGEAINVNTRETPLETDIVPTGFLGGVHIINNTIIGAGVAAIKENLNEAPGNVLYNNLIVACTPSWDQTKDQYDWAKGNNVVISLLADANFVNTALDDYRLLSGSPAINAGRDVSAYGVIFDMDNASRPTGSTWDAGAFELNGNQRPKVSVGANQSLSLPTTSTSLTGSATDDDGTIISYLWTKESGPGATLTNEATTTLSLTNLVAGEYVFRLTATDNEGGTNFGEITVTVTDPSVNQSPVASAGSDKIVALPITSTNLTGSGSDADGSIVSYSWSQTTGSAVTLVNAATATLTVNNFSVAGTYTFVLTVTDDDGATDTDDVVVTFQTVAGNVPPVANAGLDKNLTLPTNSVTLNGSGSDVDGSISSYLWTKRSGGSATLVNENTASLSLSGLAEGTYIFRLTVTDNGGLTHFDEAAVNVSSTTNQAPVANAGTDKILTLPTNSIILAGAGSDADGSIVSYAWEKVVPLSATLANQNTASLTVTNMSQGTYKFRLTVTDNGGASHTDDVLVVVQSTIPPVANAGSDKTIILPQNSTSLIGSGVDVDGTIASYTWEKVSGPGVTLGATNVSTLDLSNLVEGVYLFRLTVTDNLGASHTDQVNVFVLPAGTNQSPVVSAGSDITLTLPVNSVDITATATDSDGTISSFLWSKILGPDATVSGTASATISLSNLLEGSYTFRFTATDDKGASSSDDINVVVTSVNQRPFVNAGLDQNIILPVSTALLNAVASDPDGTVDTYLWTQTAGAAATLSGTTTSSLDISGLLQGTYVFKITVTDNLGSQSFDDVKIVVQSSLNESPVANAGNDIDLFLPTNTVNLIGSATDSDGTIASYLWEQIEGGTATLVNTGNSTATISDLVAGSYIFRITVTDNVGATAFDDVSITVHPQTTNQPPIADAGPNITLSLPVNSANLLGSGSDADGTIASYSWIKESGPVVNMTNANSAVVSLSGLVEGVYIFRLTVTDNNGASSISSCQVIVLPASINQTPLVDAGNDITIALPTNSLNVTALASDVDGSISLYNWAKQVGPTATASGEGTANLNLSDLEEGVYVYRITVTDNQGATNFDEITITILAIGSNQPPLVNAGINRIIFLPNNTLNIAGTASDEGGSITSYEWIKTQGPTVTMTNTNLATVSLSDLVAGQYTFRLTATDNDGTSSFDEVLVTVFPGTINQSPIANSGSNQTIVLPNSTATISGSGFDPDGAIVSYSWTQILGASSTLENVNSPTLIVNGLDVGVYRYQLTVTDDDGAEGSDIVEINVVPEGTNQPPIATAGFDQVINLPTNTTELNGSGTDPDGSISSFTWTKKSGPAVTMNGVTTEKLTLSDLVQGTYSFTFTVEDNEGLLNSDDVIVNVFPSSVNVNPSVDAGPDVFIRLPQSSVTLTASGTDANGTIVSYQWTKVSGPAATQSGVDSPALSLSNLVEGTYVFRIDVSDDGGFTSSDEVTIRVAPPGVNTPPVVSAGSNQTLVVPTSATTLNGSAFDNDGTIASLEWAQQAGPSTAVLGSNNTATLNVEGLVLGQYIFRLTAFDNESASAFSDVSVDVIASNQVPVIDPLSDTTLFLPTNFISFEGSASDADGFIASYEWTQVSGAPASINLENNPLIAISDLLEGSYTFALTATDNRGATATEEVTVTLREDPINPIGAAKVFSPNNDTMNDVWIVKNLTMIESCPIFIFNRLGQKVFEASNYDNSWNATIKGKPLEEGDYYYVIQCSSTKKYSGAIRLIR